LGSSVSWIVSVLNTHQVLRILYTYDIYFKLPNRMLKNPCDFPGLWTDFL